MYDGRRQGIFWRSWMRQARPMILNGFMRNMPIRSWEDISGGSGVPGRQQGTRRCARLWKRCLRAGGSEDGTMVITEPYIRKIRQGLNRHFYLGKGVRSSPGTMSSARRRYAFIRAMLSGWIQGQGRGGNDDFTRGMNPGTNPASTAALCALHAAAGGSGWNVICPL